VIPTAGEIDVPTLCCARRLYCVQELARFYLMTRHAIAAFGLPYCCAQPALLIGQVVGARAREGQDVLGERGSIRR